LSVNFFELEIKSRERRAKEGESGILDNLRAT
jgi:hypothetical protein